MPLKLYALLYALTLFGMSERALRVTRIIPNIDMNDLAIVLEAATLE